MPVMPNKTIIGPIVAFAAIIVGGIFHITLDDSTQGIIVDSIGLIIAGAYTIYGIIKNHYPHPPSK